LDAVRKTRSARSTEMYSAVEPVKDLTVTLAEVAPASTETARRHDVTADVAKDGRGSSIYPDRHRNE
jgi:hypothetical protein